VHEGGFSCEKNRQGRIEFRDPNCRLIARTGYLPTLSPEIDLPEYRRDRTEKLFIDSQTCVTKYDGGGIDWDLAVGAMFQ
jgi:hypothetical protein